MTEMTRIKIPAYAAMIILHVRTSKNSIFENCDVNENLNLIADHPFITAITNGKTIGSYLTSQSTNQNNLLGLHVQDGKHLKSFPKEVLDIIKLKEMFYHDGEFFYQFSDNEIDLREQRILCSWLKLSGINKFIYDSKTGLIGDLITRAENADIITFSSRNSGWKDNDLDFNQSGATSQYIFTDRFEDLSLVSRIRNTINYVDIFDDNGYKKTEMEIIRNVMNKINQTELVIALMEHNIFVNIKNFLQYLDNNVE